MKMPSLQISALLDAYRSGSLTVEAVMEHCMREAERIAPEAWIHRLSDDEIAPYLEVLKNESPDTRPLYGIPFAIKDNIDLADVPTTAACPAFSYVPEASAFVVQRLIDAGAIPIGKTNMDQFATGLVGTRSPYGACPNAFDPEYISGGSSSGSAVAVAEGCCSFSLGTDTAGSGRVPAAFNNLIGLKPSKGLLSCTGVIPACRSLDCISVFALDASDAQAVLDVAAAFDAADPYARELMQTPVSSECFTFGVPKPEQLNFFGNTDYEHAFAESIALLQKAGGQKVEIDFQPFIDAANLLYSGPWVNERHAAVGHFIETHGDEVLETTRNIIRSGLDYSAPEVFKAMYTLQSLKRTADDVMRSIDVLVTPTVGTCYTTEAVNADPIQLNTNLGYYTNYMNLLDYAAIAVPTVMTRPIPFGITLVSFAGSDAKLLALASRLHETSDLSIGKSAHKPVSFQPLLKTDQVDLAVCGAHLKGYPLHYQLEALGAEFVEEAHTAPEYRMYAFTSNGTAKPGLIRDSKIGGPIRVEIYRMDHAAFGQFVKSIPAPLGIGKLALVDGRTVCGFIAEPTVMDIGEEITHLGDWRKHV